MNEFRSSQPLPSEDELRMMRQWLASLPPGQQPFELAVTYPRVLIQVIHLWEKPGELLRYLDDLIVDHRGDRGGFPPDVAIEILWLDDYCRAAVDSIQSRPQPGDHNLSRAA